MTSFTPAPAELQWDAARGVPFSPRFQDIYHSAGGALAQAHHVFMQGCELPQRWSRQAVFSILETGFGLGINFLATWQAWRDDPLRCDHLHFVSIEAYPVAGEQIVAAIGQASDLQPLLPLARQLAARYPQPPQAGMHRLRFTHPLHPRQSITLTLAIGDATQLLPRLRLEADAAYLDGFSPARNPELWQPRIFKGVARLLKPQALAATWTVAAAVRKGLAEAGFIVARRPGLPPKRDALQARFVPWALRAQTAGTAAPVPVPVPVPAPAPEQAPARRSAVVIGAGMAGAAICWALALRGWQVTLVDAAGGPAEGASGLPVGLCAPHVSVDDAIVSRLTRAGAAWMRHALEEIGLPPSAWNGDGLWQVLDDGDGGGDTAQVARHAASSVPGATCVVLPGGYHGQALWHAHGLRIKGRALVTHWLAQCPGLRTRWQTRAARLVRETAAHGPASGWRVLDPAGHCVADGQLVVVASALHAPGLLASAQDDPAGAASIVVPLMPVRGQITLGRRPPAGSAEAGWPPPSITGHGHFIANWHAPQAPGSDTGGAQATWDWAMGSSFERGQPSLAPDPASDRANLDKLRLIAPDWADTLEPQFDSAFASRSAPLMPWVQVRATTPDHLPLAGAVPDLGALAALPASQVHLATLPRLPGLYTLCGLGSRGLSLAALCAELIASQACGEPWPLEAPLAEALDPARFALKQRRRAG